MADALTIEPGPCPIPMVSPMRIERIELRLVRLPLVRTFRTSSSSKDHIDHILVRAIAEGGSEGWGESASPSDPSPIRSTIQASATFNARARNGRKPVFSSHLSIVSQRRKKLRHVKNRSERGNEKSIPSVPHGYNSWSCLSGGGVRVGLKWLMIESGISIARDQLDIW